MGRLVVTAGAAGQAVLREGRKPVRGETPAAGPRLDAQRDGPVPRSGDAPMTPDEKSRRFIGAALRQATYASSIAVASMRCDLENDRMRHQLSLLDNARPAGDMPAQNSGSVVMQWMLLESYGPRLNIEQLATVLGITKGAIYNQISAETFPIATYVDGGKRWADCRDVAAHFESCRQRAHDARQAAHALVTRLSPRSARGT
jgi:hypothetical protein